MNDGDAAFAKGAGQPLRRLFLVASPDGEHHAPMAAHKIGLQRAAAFGFEERFVRPAESAQTVVAGHHNMMLRRRAAPARIARDDLADKPPINIRSRHRQARLEAGMVKELPHRARHHKAAVIISRRRLGAEGGGCAGSRIEAVLPHQLVGKGERVALETEPGK